MGRICEAGHRPGTGRPCDVVVTAWLRRRAVKKLQLLVPPVVLVLALAGLMWLAAQATPALDVSLRWARSAALVCLVAGLAVTVAGVAAFRRARTTVDPTRPHLSSSVVVSGVYRWSRNPMYLGFALCLTGWALHLGNAAAACFVPAFVLYMNRFQIAPEERALQARFGDAYAAYRRKVRRWL
jgi:protein-S-isoprenylcysteine O-methyltransferase Ste14